VRKCCKPNEVVGKLLQVKVLHGQGMAMAEATRQLGIGEVTFCGWRKEYGEVCGNQLSRLKQLENERQRDEFLNRQILYALGEAQVLIEAWRRYHNSARLHCGLRVKAWCTF